MSSVHQKILQRKQKQAQTLQDQDSHQNEQIQTSEQQVVQQQQEQFFPNQLAQSNSSQGQFSQQQQQQQYQQQQHQQQSIQQSVLQPASMHYLLNPLINQEEIKRKQEILDLISQFNCQRAFVRPTTDFFPKSQKLLLDSKLIYAAAITPYGVHSEDFPLASFGLDPIVRCENCRAYLNPYCKFTDGGYRWKCNVCGKSESIPARYYKSLDPQTGQRVDMFDRAELCQGSYDIKAGQDYCARAPQPPTYFFIIDVSKESVSSGALSTFCNTLKDVITNDLLSGGKENKLDF